MVSLPLFTMAAPPPNILWIMADDLGIGEVGFERRAARARGEASQPARAIATPHLDALAASGLTFEAAYAGYTVCAPSRTTLFTGRHSGHFVRVPSAPTFPERLRAAGYQTSAFGKSAPMDAPETGVSWRPRVLEWGVPTLYGFDTFVGQTNQTLAHNMYPTSLPALRPSSVAAQNNSTLPLPLDSQNSTLHLPLNSKSKSRSLCMAQPDQYNYTTDVFNHAALDWLRHERNVTRPFFLYLSYTVPHAGGWASAPLAPEEGNPVASDLQYASQTLWPEVERDHAASITYLDARIGEVMAALDALQLTNNTIVWFASDNGPHNEGGHSVDFFSSSGGLRGYKRSLYEGGVRTPSIVRWPGVTQPGGRSATPWAFWDVYPTILEMVGLSLADADSREASASVVSESGIALQEASARRASVAIVASAGAGSPDGPEAEAGSAARRELAAGRQGNGGGDLQDGTGDANHAMHMASTEEGFSKQRELAAGRRRTGSVGLQDGTGDRGSDGRSIVPALRGEPQPPPRYMFWTWREHPGHDASVVFEGGNAAMRRSDNATGDGRLVFGQTPFSSTVRSTGQRTYGVGEGQGVGYAARMGDWKLIVHRCADHAARVPSLADAGAAELYHLLSDRGEKRDLAAKQPGVLREMLDVLADPSERLSCECFQC